MELELFLLNLQRIQIANIKLLSAGKTIIW